MSSWNLAVPCTLPNDCATPKVNFSISFALNSAVLDAMSSEAPYLPFVLLSHNLLWFVIHFAIPNSNLKQCTNWFQNSMYVLQLVCTDRVYACTSMDRRPAWWRFSRLCSAGSKSLCKHPVMCCFKDTHSLYCMSNVTSYSDLCPEHSRNIYKCYDCQSAGWWVVTE